MLTTLILVVLGGYLWIYLTKDFIKLSRACILLSWVLCFYLIPEGICVKLTIIDMTLQLLKLLIVLIPWYNLILIFYEPIEETHLGIWVCYWSRNYLSVLPLVNTPQNGESIWYTNPSTLYNQFSIDVVCLDIVPSESGLIIVSPSVSKPSVSVNSCFYSSYKRPQLGWLLLRYNQS